MARIPAICLGILLLIIPGCLTHHRLSLNSTRQALTISQIHQQQVLDNLAMFVHDANAWPFFAIPEGGSSVVSDGGGIGASVDWVRSGFSGTGLRADGSRRVDEGWTLIPVNDPHKLALMRCAYVHAVEGCSCVMPLSADCPNCKERMGEFQKGHEHQDLGECMGQCWFRIGCEDCLPNHCTLVGKYCGTCVWVEPGYGQDELSKLTMQILEYALYEPVTAPVPTKEVVRYFDSSGRPTSQTNAVRVETSLETVTQKEAEAFRTYLQENLELQKAEPLRSMFLQERLRQDLLQRP